MEIKTFLTIAANKTKNILSQNKLFKWQHIKNLCFFKDSFLHNVSILSRGDR
ncbi:hypothetical protein CWATWH0402_524 [Crocosphaera watsonii WH 0402]|uniref:Uncharacterized protein n=1 Tax=Crocosphaera watsonii WH 0402 TaxID=1284629 RepID=T2JZY3_CROWT|nr:hypothetical protein CWATWH0402_524 [Crocosphaera watsonii WH 0402]